MNEGARLDEIIHTVRAPAHLLERPYLRPIYDEPEFVVRNVWRLYGGWYDGNPAHLKPAPDAALAARGGRRWPAAPTGSRRGPPSWPPPATTSCASPATSSRWPRSPAPDDAGVHGARADVFGAGVAAERRRWPRAIFGWAASQPAYVWGASRHRARESWRSCGRAGSRAARTTIPGSLSPGRNQSSHGRRRRDPTHPGSRAPPHYGTPARPRRSLLRLLLVEARPKQWVKNLLVFAAPAAAGVINEGTRAPTRSPCSCAFCLAASGTYFLNDAADVEADRLHPKKRFRPIAAGEIPLPLARVIGVATRGLGLAGAPRQLAAGPSSSARTSPLTTTYSLWIKHVAVLDVVGVVAAGFVLRAIAGAARRRRADLGLVLHRGRVRVALHGGRQAAAEAEEMGTARRVPRRRWATPSTCRGPGHVRSVATGVVLVGYCLWAFEKAAPSDAGVPWFELSIIPFAARRPAVLAPARHRQGWCARGRRARRPSRSSHGLPVGGRSSPSGCSATQTLLPAATAVLAGWANTAPTARGSSRPLRRRRAGVLGHEPRRVG